MKKTGDLILIKLGGSLITNKSIPFTAKPDVINVIAKEIKSARKKNNSNLLIAHGSGSFGHTVAAKYKTSEGYKRKLSHGFPLVANAAREINTIVMKEFLAQGLPVVSFSPLSFLYTNKKKPKKSHWDPIIKSLALGYIPVIYGDVIMDESRGFCIYSGETTLDLFAKSFAKTFTILKVIQAGDTDGVFDAENNVIKEINSSNIKNFSSAITGSKSIDVTGGMVHKVHESLTLAMDTGIPTWIINGNKRGRLSQSIIDKTGVGTKITL